MTMNYAVISVPAPQKPRIANPLLGIFNDLELASKFVERMGRLLYTGFAKPEEINDLTVGVHPDHPILSVNMRIDNSGWEARFLIVPLAVQSELAAEVELAEAS
jgi:hypothetical protein